MKYIITESQELSLKNKLKNKLNNFGIEITSKIVGGIDNLFKVLDINSPMEFLHLFDDLNIVQSEEYENLTLFRYKPKHNLMVYDRKNEYVYINYDDVWSVLKEQFGLNYDEIQELTKEWLDEVYNLRGITTCSADNSYFLKVG